MPIKFFKRIPPPVPQPPPTFGLDGLSAQQVLWLKDVIIAEETRLNEALRNNGPHFRDLVQTKLDFFGRVRRVFDGNADERQE
jgi:hypothetical protein